MIGSRSSRLVASLFLLLFLSLSSPVHADSGNTVVGGTVKWSSAQGDLLVWPHTARDLGGQTQYANLTWEGTSTNIDVAFKFSIPVSGKIWLWQNISHPVTVYDYKAETVCSTVKDNTTLQNVTVCRNQTVIWGSHTEQRYYYDWDDVTSVLTHTVANGSHYYWVNNVAFAQGGTKQVKWQYKVPINSSGKWSLLVKRSQDTLESALAGNLFVELDPWWNSSWAYKKNITITNNHASTTLPTGYTVNVTFDHASLVSDGKSLASGNDVRVVYNGATELDGVNITAFNTGTTTIIFRTQANIPASGSASNYELYYGNPSAGTPLTNWSNIWDRTNNTALSQVASASSTWGAPYVAGKAVDGFKAGPDYNSVWLSADAQTSGWWKVDTGATVRKVYEVFVYNGPLNNDYDIKDFFVRASTDDATYTNLTKSGQVMPATDRYEYRLNITNVNPLPTRYLQIQIQSKNGVTGLGLAEVEVYTSPYISPEPTVGLSGEINYTNIALGNPMFSPLFGITGTNFTFSVSVNNSIPENTNVDLTVLNASNATVATGSTSLANGSGVASVSVQINDIGAHTYHWNASSSQSGVTRFPTSGELNGPTVSQNATFSQYKMVPVNVSKLIWSVAWGKLVTGGTTGAVNLSLKDPYNTTYNEFSTNVETSILELRNLNVTLPVIGYELGYYSEVRKVAVNNPTAGLWEMRVTQDGNVITFETRVQMNSAG